MSTRLKIAVGIASAGRRELLSELLRELALQTRLLDMALICPAQAQDFDGAIAAQLSYPIKVVTGRTGASAQRNAILDAASGFDVIVFFDDDFIPARSYLEELETCFRENNDIVAASGQVILDGVTGAGIGLPAARAALDAYRPNPEDDLLPPQYSAYGCNMAFRLAPVRARSVRFDENLPFYSWLEDVDFSRQLAPSGRIVRCDRLVGVHLGVKGGRTSGFRFGYSQIANPVYLWRKGTLRTDRALGQIMRNVAANLRGLIRPEPWIDRGGRVRGNLTGFYHLLTGRLDPRHIIEFSAK